MIEFILAKYNYWVCIILMMIGFYGMIAKENLIKKIIGMNIFQVAVFLFYISMSKVHGGTAPIDWYNAGQQPVIYDNPLPHVLILTAIVVGVSTTALGLALVIKIQQAYGSIEENKILELNRLEEEKNLEMSR